MPARYPPEGTPTGKQSRRDSRSKSRIVAYAEPELSFKRRALRRLLSPFIVIPLAVLVVVVIGCLVYYWSVFSGRIDNLLAGEVFTRSAGIYAAPKQLRAGQALTPDKLIEFLKHAGYVEKSMASASFRVCACNSPAPEKRSAR